MKFKMGKLYTLRFEDNKDLSITFFGKSKPCRIIRVKKSQNSKFSKIE